MTSQRFLDLLDTLPQAKVLCLGDLILDQYVYGQVSRISPEAPVPVLAIDQEVEMLGGAGNVMRNLSSLGVTACLLGVVGDDATGHRVQQSLEALPKATASLLKVPNRRTSLKIRHVCSGHQLLRADFEDAHTFEPDVYDALFKMFQAQLPHYSVVVLSDYGKGLFPPAFVARLIEEAKRQGAFVIVDPKHKDFRVYKGADLITPNLKEAQEAVKFPLKTDADIIQGAQCLQRDADIAHILITRSQDGMTLIQASGAVDHLKAQAQEVFDVSGAGDTVVSALAASLAVNPDLLLAATFANVAAGLVVRKIGTATVTPAELKAALDLQAVTQTDTKVVATDTALQRILQWRQQGQKIGFTNGCFDLLHVGHISLLEQAKQACDRLVVALNTDQSIQNLKGPTRPLQNETDRSRIMAALGMVDLVVLFDEATPLALIQRLKPDVLVKGSDYTLEQIVGAQDVLGWGGQVLRVDLVPQKSTTNIVKKMAS